MLNTSSACSAQERCRPAVHPAVDDGCRVTRQASCMHQVPNVCWLQDVPELTGAGYTTQPSLQQLRALAAHDPPRLLTAGKTFTCQVALLHAGCAQADGNRPTQCSPACSSCEPWQRRTLAFCKHMPLHARPSTSRSGHDLPGCMQEVPKLTGAGYTTQPSLQQLRRTLASWQPKNSPHARHCTLRSSPSIAWLRAGGAQADWGRLHNAAQPAAAASPGSAGLWPPGNHMPLHACPSTPLRAQQLYCLAACRRCQS